jgi:hypothetical protein
MTLQDLHERLLSWASAPPREEDLLRAKREHFEAYGEPHEEDRSFELRVNGMLDAYLYDHRPARGVGTTAERFVEAEAASLTPDELAAYRALAQTVHGLFEVRKIKEGRVRVRDVFTGKDLDVTERRQVAGLAEDDLIEARLLPFEGGLFFSGAFIWHPREARKTILAEVKRMKKGAPRGVGIDPKPFLARLSRMALKMERYRNVRLESIYDFSPEARTWTPAPRPPGPKAGQGT